MNTRVANLKESLLNNYNHNTMFIERMILLEEADEKYNNLDKGSKYANSFSYLLSNMSVIIKNNEIIVGGIKEDIPDKFTQKLFNKLSQEKNFSAAQLFTFDPLNVVEIKDPPERYAPDWFNHWGHFTPNWEKIISIGFGGIKKEAEEKLFNERLNDMQRSFLNNVIIVAESMSAFINRYSKLAKKLSQEVNDKDRKNELLQISKCCENISTNPPESFYEAIQLIWFIYMTLQCVCGARDYALGRMDKYLIHLYNHDIKTGMLKRDKALEIIECFFIKLNEIIGRGVEFYDIKRVLHVNSLQYIIVAGQGQDDMDVTNELSYLILDAVSELKLKQPTVVVRYHNNMDRKFFSKACELAKLGLGYPTFYNDKTVIKALVNSGIKRSEAVNYVHYGCNNPNFPGKEDELREVWHNLPKYLEFALNQGICGITGRQIGVKTESIENINNMEDLLLVFRLQIRNAMELTKKKLEESDKLWNRLRPFSFESLFIDDCIQKAEDMSLNGTQLKHANNHAVGIATAINSIYAINKLVFEEKRLSLQEFNNVLTSNYEGNEKLRLEIKNKLNKFGNDLQDVDIIAKKVGEIFCEEVLRAGEVKFNRRKMWASFYSLWHHRKMGEATGATADGRLCGEPISESQSPVYDTEKKGPTAVLNSISKLPFEFTPGGGLNIKFQSNWFKGPLGSKILEGLIEGYFEKGGLQMQINILDKETLIDAKNNPQNHKNLLVRVVGYSAYFITLSPEQQDELISRSTL